MKMPGKKFSKNCFFMMIVLAFSMGFQTRSFPPHPNPLPPGERGGHSSPAAELGGYSGIF
jgi:hypothetical protein